MMWIPRRPIRVDHPVSRSAFRGATRVNAQNDRVGRGSTAAWCWFVGNIDAEPRPTACLDDVGVN